MRGKLQLQGCAPVRSRAGFCAGQAFLPRQKHRPRIARRELERGVQALIRQGSQQDGLQAPKVSKPGVAGRLQNQGLRRFDITCRQRLELVNAARERRVRLPRRRVAGQQAATVLRVREVIPQRLVVRVRRDPGGEILNQIHQGIAILRLVRIQDLRLQVAALLSRGGRRQQQQRRCDEIPRGPHAMQPPARP